MAVHFGLRIVHAVNQRILSGGNCRRDFWPRIPLSLSEGSPFTAGGGFYHGNPRIAHYPFRSLRTAARNGSVRNSGAGPHRRSRILTYASALLAVLLGGAYIDV